MITDITAIYCEMPSDVQNGSYDIETGVNVGDRVLITCDTGYIIHGSSAITTSSYITCLLQPDDVTALWSDQPACTGKVKCTTI
jgi:hypothetical protein